MNKTIYKIIIFDAVENEHNVDSTIFWDLNAARKEAERIYSDPEIPADTISVYEEVADKDGSFHTTKLVSQLKRY